MNSIPSLHPAFICLYMSRSVVGWHDSRQCRASCSGDVTTGAMPIPPKLPCLHSISLSFSRSLRLIDLEYKSQMQRGACLEGGDGMKKDGKNKACRGENGEKLKETGEEERNIRSYFCHTHYLPSLSWNGWNDFQTGDFSINHWHTRAINDVRERQSNLASVLLCNVNLFVRNPTLTA